MKPYRIALILCRAVSVALWWSAGLHSIAVALMAIGGSSGLFGNRFPMAQIALQSLITIIPTAIAAGFLQIFAASLANSMVGGATFESDSIASRRVLDATEKVLSSAGAGLFLLFFGAASAIPSVLAGAYKILFDGGSSASLTNLGTALLINGTIAPVLQCAVGFVLAFSLGLRRLMKSGESV